MLFNSLEFLLFLPAVFALYWVIHARFKGPKGLTLQNALLLVASYVFYGWWDWLWAKAYAKLTSVSRSPFAWMTMLYYPIRRHFAPAGVRAGQDPNGIYSGRGFVYRTFPPLMEIPHEEMLNVDLSSVEIDALNRLSKLCEGRDIELILINPPQLIEESFIRPDCMQGIAWIEGNNWPGAKISRNYYDDHHLVGEGAQQYSHWLAGQIRRQAKSLR